jgi:hypothetical protein
LLNGALKRMHRNQVELLLALERPELPLHNNLSETDIREYVKRRKISGVARRDAGRRGRDTFASLKKTCRKLGVSFWRYLNDRIRNLTTIPPLAALIQARAQPPPRDFNDRHEFLRSYNSYYEVIDFMLINIY